MFRKVKHVWSLTPADLIQGGGEDFLVCVYLFHLLTAALEYSKRGGMDARQVRQVFIAIH